MLEKVFIAGGAGFIGSHFVDRLLSMPAVKTVTVYDNFSSGQRWHLAHHKDERLRVVVGDITNHNDLSKAMSGHDTVIHLASNPDLAKAVTTPTIDFDQGSALTQFIVEAMRVSGAKRILYASGSGVYGELGYHAAREDQGLMMPISTYGASKLAGEALISAYTAMFGLTGVAFRFGNVVGPRQTHGVGYDFIRKLRQNPNEIDIFGDGTQSKSYVYISDIVDAVLLANEKVKERYDVFNVATGDYITVKEIADCAVEEVLGKNAKVNYKYSGGDRGWKGDVPIVRLNCEKIEALGFRRKYSSAEAIRQSIVDMLQHEKVTAGTEAGTR